MKIKTDTVLTIMTVLSYITLFGLIVEAGAILISFGVRVAHNDVPKSFDNEFGLHENSFIHYTLSVSFKAAIILLEAYIASLVIKVLNKIKLENPFTIEISQRLEKISYYILAAWIIALLNNAQTHWLMKRFGGIEDTSISTEFIFMAGVVFVIAQIFKKGVEIQSENELTV